MFPKIQKKAKNALKLIYNKQNRAYGAHHMSLKNSYHGKKIFWSKIDFLKKNIDSYIKNLGPIGPLTRR